LALTPNGDTQVRKVSNDVLLWSSGAFPNDCPTASSCSLTFGANGALQLNGPGGLIWTTGTIQLISADNPTPVADRLVLSGYAPYLSILSISGNKRPVMWGTGATASSVTYAAGALTLGAGQKVAFGGALLSMPVGSDLQTVNSAGSPVWHSNTGNCSASCSLRFLDGNLVLNQSVSISQNTGGNPGSYLHLSATDPYLVIENAKLNKLWSSSTGKETSIPPAQASPPVRGITNKANTVQSFLDSLGVNSHQDQYESNAAVSWQKLSEIGVRHVRDHAPKNSTEVAWFNYLTTRGIRFTLVNYNTEIPVLLEQATTVANLPRPSGASPNPLAAIEGKNEINNFGFNFNGFQCDAGSPNICGGAAADSQLKLKTAVHDDATIGATPVYDLTAGLTAMHARLHGLDTFSSRADFGNVHVYPDATQPFDALSTAMGSDYKGLYATQGVVTESGYASDKVGEVAQAIMGINMWLDGYRLGYQRTFLYTLSDASNQTKDLFGLYNGAGARKPLATAAMNLTTVLADAGVPLANTDSLNWSTSTPFTGSSLLLQKSNRVFYLILWREPAVVQVNSNGQWSNLNPNYPSFQLNVDPSYYIKVYDPLQSTPLVYTSPANTTVSGVSLNVSTHPLIVEIKRY
jgi:hypothetical protein